KPKAPQPTHFLCIPLTRHASLSEPISDSITSTSTNQPPQQQLSANIARFKQDVTQPAELGGFSLVPDAVRPTGTLHLTLGMMSFPQNGNNHRHTNSQAQSSGASDIGHHEGETALGHALEVLRALKPLELMERSSRQRPVIPDTAAVVDAQQHQSLAPRLAITLQGLRPMQKRLDKTTVLYAAPTDPDGTIQAFAEAVRSSFQDAGLLVVDDRPLLLHATIVNTIYVKARNNNSDKKRGSHGKREVHTIKNVQGILDRYENQIWMQDMPLDRIAICKMGAKPISRAMLVDAAYEVEAEIEF
ncbi:kinase A anchor protein, partial [Coniella lustricola]